MAWDNETSETSTPFIEVPISNPESEGVIYFASFYNVSIRFRNCSDGVLLFVFILLLLYKNAKVDKTGRSEHQNRVSLKIK